jgi:hypothetical protein
MAEGGRKEKHVLIHERLNDRRVGSCGTTPELFGKIIRVSSGNRCKKCITLIRGTYSTEAGVGWCW